MSKLPLRAALLVLTSVTVALALGLPCAANATTWTVRNASGHSVGKVVSSSALGATVYGASGSHVGDVILYEGEWDVNAPHDSRYLGNVRKNGDGWAIASSPGSSVLLGRERAGAARWHLQRRVSGEWRLRGFVARSCLGQYAAGALRLLLWR